MSVKNIKNRLHKKDKMQSWVPLTIANGTWYPSYNNAMSEKGISQVKEIKYEANSKNKERNRFCWRPATSQLQYQFIH